MMASPIDTGTFPFPRRPWGQRLVQNATSSTVQTLFNRELGFPGFPKNEDNFGNNKTIRPTLRQLVYQRLPSLSEEPVLPILIKLNDQGVRNGTINRKRIPNTWIKIVTALPERILWVGEYLRQTMPLNRNAGTGGFGRNSEYSNSFYKLENDISLGFKRFRCAASTGLVQMGEFINIRNLGNNPSGLVYATLATNGIIRFYDLSHHNNLTSPQSITLPVDENLRCTDMYVDHFRAYLYVLGTLNGTVKRIFKISYPSLEIMDSKRFIINHAKFGPVVKMVIEQSVVLISTNSEVYLGNIDDYFLPGQPEDLEIPVLPKGTVIKTTNHYFSMIDNVWPPVFITMSNPAMLKAKFHITSMHDGRQIWSKTFSPHDECTVNPVMTEYALVLQKFNDTYSIIHVKKDSCDLPTYQVIEDTEHALLKTSLENIIASQRVSCRPMRKCAREKLESDRLKFQKRDRFIAIDYSDVLDLIGVCILEEGVLVVSLYESRTHKVFKRLPSLKVREFRSRRRGISDDDDQSPSTEMAMDFEFDSDLVFVTIEYPHTNEYYILNLLGEDASFTL